ncbi:hypothetical protein ACLK1T_09760 [Escherichia coli]
MSGINLGLPYSPQQIKLSRGRLSFQFCTIANNFGSSSLYDICHFGLSGQHCVQNFTADVERGAQLGIAAFYGQLSTPIVQRQVEVIAVAHIEVQADIFTRLSRHPGERT